MSVLKWIWGLLKRLLAFLEYLVSFVVQIFSSVLAWLIAGLSWLIYAVWDWVGDAFENVFDQLLNIQVGGLPVQPLADWLGHDVLALDVAWTSLAICLSAWFAAKLARLSMTFVRLVIDLL